MIHSTHDATRVQRRTRTLTLVEPGCSGDLLQSVTFVLNGRQCGTFSVNADLDVRKPLRLYVVPAVPHGTARAFDCLVTDEAYFDDPEIGEE